jgi:hypothetical protein
MPAEKKKHTRRPPDDNPLAPAPVPEKEGLALPQGGLRLPQGGLRLLAYLLALFPFYGFLLGLIYTPQPNAESKKFGHLCFILAVVGLVGMVFLWGLGALWKGLTAAESGGMGGGYF